MGETGHSVDTLYYRALALQVTCHAVNALTDRDQVRGRMRETIDRLSLQIAASIAFLGRDTKLVQLPEYFLTGFPMGETIEGWALKAGIEMNGPEYEALGRIAQDNRIFLSGNAYELDSHFPGLYFQTCFVIDPGGRVVLRYRRLNSMFAPTPHDVWTRYLEVYGLEGVFPVARTEIGNLGAVASDEILFPEIARCMAMRGAEVLLHPSSEIFGRERSAKEICKLARAVENQVYVISANSAGILGTSIPVASVDGGSKIVDYRGLVLAEAGAGESIAAYADLDLPALRRSRRRPGMANLLSRQRYELYADSYRGSSFYPPDSMLQAVPSRDHFLAMQRRTIARLEELDLI
ncbi:MAG: nitrilase [Acidobacteria bacterium]|nr:nitrilase [Acidobacteriota bacterium]